MNAVVAERGARPAVPTAWMPARIETAAIAPQPGVILYGESDLRSREASDGAAMPRFVRDLVSTRSAPQRERLVRDRLAEIGFDWMGYYTVRPQPGGAVERAYLVTYSQADWIQRYFDEHYEEIDPCQCPSAGSSLPHLWDIDSVDDAINARPPSTQSRNFLRDLHDSGLCSGLSFQVPPRKGHPAECTIVSLASSESSRRWMGDRVLADSLLLGLSMHEYLTQHTTRVDKSVDGAAVCGAGGEDRSPLQKAILACVVRGLTDRQIADQLAVSSHAVDYHLRRLRQRFGVRNRVQLANAATRAAEAM